ncbi:hypothetical protein [Paraburkholderia solisilvae]|uniref:hypothetical protein n=1 Tax=Paraburkholderia solisilvae TaxID=624376 RepID=UPI001582DA1A|nr:hypothetical protein [Paraburkholderia solisilvae]
MLASRNWNGDGASVGSSIAARRNGIQEGAINVKIRRRGWQWQIARAGTPWRRRAETQKAR